MDGAFALTPQRVVLAKAGTTLKCSVEIVPSSHFISDHQTVKLWPRLGFEFS
jgi:hypothetical protein